MLKIKEDDFENLEHYDEMLSLLMKRTDEIISVYKQNSQQNA